MNTKRAFGFVGKLLPLVAILLLALTGCGASGKNLSIIKNGVTNYCIVIPENPEDFIQDSAISLQKKIYKETEVSMKILSDTAVTDLKKIYLGNTSSELSQKVMSELSYGSYGVGTSGDEMYAVAYTQADMKKAVNIIRDKMLEALKKDSIKIEAFEEVKDVRDELTDVPVYVTEKGTTVFNAGSEFYEIRVEEADSKDFASYTKALKEKGYTVHSAKKIGNAEYAVYKNDKHALYVNQFDSAMRIVYSDIKTAFLPETEQSAFEKVCDTKGYMVGVTGGADENGMCFVYLLADGTFLIYDGGLDTPDADHLYEILHRVAGQHGINEVVISNWMLTHAHGDHCGCWEPFFRQYADKVKIERVMFNTSHSDLGNAISDSQEESAMNSVKTYSPDTELVRLHSGQDFWLADMKVEVLYTIEDLEPGSFEDYNDASTITRLTINDETILMTGDAAFGAWGLMCKAYGNAMKSDYLQVPHHGAHDGGTKAAYDLIQPTYLLWPCGDKLYADDLTSWNKDYGTNLHLLKMVKPENSYVAGVYDAINKTERITEFPFSK